MGVKLGWIFIIRVLLKKGWLSENKCVGKLVFLLALSLLKAWNQPTATLTDEQKQLRAGRNNLWAVRKQLWAVRKQLRAERNMIPCRSKLFLFVCQKSSKRSQQLCWLQLTKRLKSFFERACAVSWIRNLNLPI